MNLEYRRSARDVGRMRAYNAAAPPDKKLKFVGFDIQTNREAYDTAMTFLKKVAPDRATDLAALPLPRRVGTSNEEDKRSLETLIEAMTFGPEAGRPAAFKQVSEFSATYLQLFGFMELNETKFIPDVKPDADLNFAGENRANKLLCFLR